MTIDVSIVEKDYHRYVLRKILFIVGCAIAMILVLGYAATIGTSGITAWEVYRDIFYHFVDPSKCDSEIDWVVFTVRLPRIMTGLIAGMSLGVAGAAMQSMMKNPLADPYTTGISSGALLGVAMAMVLGFHAGAGGIDGYGTLMNALVFAMIPVLVIYALSPFLNRSPSTLILAGTAVSYLFSSLTSLLLVSTDAETLSGVYHWQVGKLSDLTWDAVPFVFVVCLVGTCILMMLSNKLNLMSLEDKDAKALGMDSEKLRLVCLIVLSFMAASIISFVGIIGFVGLIVPHMVRLIIGSDYRFVIPGSVVVGGAFLLGCDIVSRSIDVSATIPVGVITSLIGAPIFLYLIIRQKREVW